MYVDGVAKSSKLQGLCPNLADFTVGYIGKSNFAAYDGVYVGFLDNFFVYGQVLEAWEVQENLPSHRLFKVV